MTDDRRPRQFALVSLFAVVAWAGLAAAAYRLMPSGATAAILTLLKGPLVLSGSPTMTCGEVLAVLLDTAIPIAAWTTVALVATLYIRVRNRVHQ